MTLVETAMGGVSPTITGDHQDRVTDYTAIVLNDQGANEHHKQCGSDFESCGASASTRCDGAFEYKAGVKF